MRPSRNRDERKHGVQYLPEDELKREIDKQVQEKKKRELLERMKDKEDIIKHYENYRIGGDATRDTAGEDNRELQRFLDGKRQELSPRSRTGLPRLRRIHRRSHDWRRRLSGGSHCFGTKTWANIRSRRQS